MRRWLLMAKARRTSQLAGTPREGWQDNRCLVMTSGAELNDGILLWRPGHGGGLVASGVIDSPAPPTKTLRLGGLHLRGAEWSVKETAQAPPVGWRVLLEQFALSSPIQTADVGDSIVAAALDRALRSVQSEGKDEIPLDVDDRGWQRILEILASPPQQSWPAAWNITPGDAVVRDQLHEVYGGHNRKTASSSARTPNAFLFIKIQRLAEAQPRWDGATLIAAGNPQWYSELTEDNEALLTHLRRGRPLRVFRAHGQYAVYIGEFVVDQLQPVVEWIPNGDRYVSERPRFDTGTSGPKPIRIERDKVVPLVRLVPLHSVDRSLISAEQANGILPARSLSLSLAAGEPNGHHLGTHTNAIRTLRQALDNLTDQPELVSAIAQLEVTKALVELVQRSRRRQALDDLDALIDDPDAKEHDFQDLLEGMTWIFGGEYQTHIGRRELTAQDQVDLSLLRPDGTLHAVELKLANIKHLVTGRHGQYKVGAEVNKALGQAMNYLERLDEQRHAILSEFHIDCRRASITILIGSPRHIAGEITTRDINATLRRYNSHLTRIRVCTYDEILNTARMSLDPPDWGNGK